MNVAGADAHKLGEESTGYASATALATEMGRKNNLKSCLNAVALDPENLEAPFSQLGCSGFVVLDADHAVVSPKTAAYLTVKTWAFKHVDALLDATVHGKHRTACTLLDRLFPGGMR